MKLNSRALKLENNHLLILDQQLLPLEEKWIDIESPPHMIDIIKALKVRGAPLIGVAAALSLALWAKKTNPKRDEFLQMADAMEKARPTAINLMNAVDRLIKIAAQKENFAPAVFDEAVNIFNEDVELCEDRKSVV